jgi:hypothetical protein
MVREIVARQKQGQAVRMIARDLRVNRRTVKRWLKLGKWEARQQRPRLRQIDQYKSFIERHGPKVLWNARALLRALTGAGFTGSYGQVQRFVRSTPWFYTRWARAAKLRFGSLTQQVAFEWMRAVLQKEIKSRIDRRTSVAPRPVFEADRLFRFPQQSHGRPGSLRHAGRSNQVADVPLSSPRKKLPKP